MLIFMTVSTYEDSFFLKKQCSPLKVFDKKQSDLAVGFFWFFFVGLLGIHPVFVYVHTVY